MELVSIMEALEEGAYLVDLERRITYWSPAAEKITGFSSGEVTGRRCSDNILRHVSAEGIELCIHGCPLHATMSDGKLREAEAYLHHKDGHRVPVFIRAMAIKNDEAEITGSIELFSDKTDRSTLLAELEQLRHEILTDPLTGLGNRRYMEIMSTARFETFKNTGVPFGVIMIDIDHFKRVNDTYGHLVGDKILKMTAKTLQGAVRPLDTAIRYGGEEMLILCPNCDLAAIGEIAERVRMLVSHSWLDEGDISRLQVTVSVGGALARTTDDLASLVARADERLYDCKRNGRNRCLVGE